VNDKVRDPIESGLRRPRPVSENAKRAFAEALPVLVEQINEKFAVRSRIVEPRAAEELAFLYDAHAHFGEMLRAVFEFSLYRHMVSEFGWYVSVLASRGLDEAYFREMVNGWIIAVHSIIKPPESDELSAVLEWLSANLGAIYRATRRSGPELTEDARGFLDLVLAKSRRGAVDFAFRLRRRDYDIERVYAEVVLPVLARVGQLWQANEITVSDEHAATEICRYVIMRLVDELPVESPLGLRALVACVPGEQHDIPVQLAAGLLEAGGWDVLYLGRSVPEDDLLKIVIESQPAVCVFSVSLIGRLPAARDMFAKIRGHGAETAIIAGGHAAEIADDALSPYVDAIVTRLEEVGGVALRLAGGHA
jgi:methanogenic corrinoid protein MtbC1